MKEVKKRLAAKQIELSRHTFFSRLGQDRAFEEQMDFAAGLTFWVFAFQDILRLNEARMIAPELRRIARHHRAEDLGHDAWFLSDLDEIDPAPRDLCWLFGPHHEHTRDVAYSLVAEVFRASCDYVRVALLYTLESAGHVFFGRMAELVDRAGEDRRLLYFSRHHLTVEKAHELLDADHTDAADIVLPEPVRAEALAMVERCFRAFDDLFTGLEARSERRSSGRLSVPPESGIGLMPHEGGLDLAERSPPLLSRETAASGIGTRRGA